MPLEDAVVGNRRFCRGKAAGIPAFGRRITANRYILPPVYQRFLEREMPTALWVETSGAVICKYFGGATGSAKINLSKGEASAQI